MTIYIKFTKPSNKIADLTRLRKNLRVNYKGFCETLKDRISQAQNVTYLFKVDRIEATDEFVEDIESFEALLAQFEENVKLYETKLAVARSVSQYNFKTVPIIEDSEESEEEGENVFGDPPETNQVITQETQFSDSAGPS